MRKGYHLIPALKQNLGNRKFKGDPGLGVIWKRWLTILDTVWYQEVGTFVPGKINASTLMEFMYKNRDSSTVNPLALEMDI